MSTSTKFPKATRPADLQCFDGPYVSAADLCHVVRGRSGGPAHVNTINAMVSDGRLPPADIGGGKKGPRKWRKSRAINALRKLERREVR
jgi:hypothetical protein